MTVKHASCKKFSGLTKVAMDTEERPAKLRKVSHDGDEQPSSSALGLGEFSTSNSSSRITQYVNEDERLHRQDAAVYRQEKGHDESAAMQSTYENGETGLPPPAEIAPSVNSHDPSSFEGMSKNQMKKLRKKQEWESKRDERKAVRKEKVIAKRERKRAARAEAEAANDGAVSNDMAMKAKKQPQQKPVTLPITILIDCDFDDLMRDNERISLAAQITRSYSDNKNSLYRAHLTVCSFGGKLRERFEGVLAGMYRAWKGVRCLDEDFVAASVKAKGWMNDEATGGAFSGPVFSKYNDITAAKLEALKAQGEVVYLSSESDETLTELKPYSTYIIGGLVDKNREKGICYKRACQAGVRTARLPIGEFMEMQSRKVLATNHVNEILLKWLETGDWGEAFYKVIPKRKGGKLKGREEGSEFVEDEDEAGGVDAVEDLQNAHNAGVDGNDDAEDHGVGWTAPVSETRE